MKTCEEYVLKELEEAKEKILDLTGDRVDLCCRLQEVHAFLDVLKKYMFVAEGAGGRRYIEMKYVFEDFEKEDFETLEEMLLHLEEDGE